MIYDDQKRDIVLISSKCETWFGSRKRWLLAGVTVRPQNTKSRLEVLLSDIVRQRLQKIEASWQFGGITVRRDVDSLFRVRSRKEHCFLLTS